MKELLKGLLGWIVVGGACLVLGWYARELKGFGAKKAGPARETLPAVATDVVASEIFNPPEEFVGYVEPVQEVDILPQIEGYLKEVKFAEGDAVKAGDLLYVIDDERYAAADGVARAELLQAKSKVAQCEAAVDRSERYLKRLSAADERGVTETEKDAAETGLAADRAALASAKAAVSQSEAKLAETAFSLKHTKVYAPISGRIGKSLQHTGDYVSPSKSALARIVQTDPVRVTFPVTDRAYLAWGTNGAKIGDTRRLRLRLANGTLYPHDGNWAFSDNEMSAETATITVRALFANALSTLVPNAYVTVLADEAAPKPVPTVPFLALAKAGERTGVWLVDGDTVSFREVKEGGRYEGRVRILEGVKPGDKIVVQGVHKLGEGMRVSIVPASDFH